MTIYAIFTCALFYVNGHDGELMFGGQPRCYPAESIGASTFYLADDCENFLRSRRFPLYPAKNGGFTCMKADVPAWQPTR